MLNIQDGTAVLRDAETISTSSLLTKNEKAQLISELLLTMPPAMNRHFVTITVAALERLHGNLIPAKERKAAGKQDATPVASEPGEGGEANNARPTEGQSEQAQNAGSVPSPRNDGNDTAEASSAAQKPKPGKARK